MNKSIILYAIMLLFSCNHATNNAIPEGMFTCIHEHEFARTEDTFHLERINENYFQLTRRAGVTMFNDSTALKQQVTETWKLEYDPEKKAFTELKKGKILIWNSAKQALIFGNKEYVKSK